MNEDLIQFSAGELEALSADVQKQAKGGIWPVVVGGLIVWILMRDDGGKVEEVDNCHNNGCTFNNCRK